VLFFERREAKKNAKTKNTALCDACCDLTVYQTVPGTHIHGFDKNGSSAKGSEQKSFRKSKSTRTGRRSVAAKRTVKWSTITRHRC
jgi:hypothetical protein